MKKSFKKLVLALAGILMVFLVAGCANKPVATMKGGKITEKELYQEMKSSTAGKQAFQQMIILKALDNQYGKDVSQKKIDKQYNDYKKQYGQQFEQVLSQNGMSTKSFKNNIKMNLLTQVAVKDQKKITNKDLKKEWKNYQPKITVRHILVDSEEKANDIINQLNNGADFAKLAKKESTDPGTKKKGGLLPAFDKTGKLDKDFMKAAFDLKKPGEYTETPVKSSYGYHVIELVKKPSKGSMKDHEKELKDKIYAKATQDQKVMANVMTNVLKKADISIKDNDLKDVLAGFNLKTK